MPSKARFSSTARGQGSSTRPRVRPNLPCSIGRWAKWAACGPSIPIRQRRGLPKGDNPQCDANFGFATLARFAFLRNPSPLRRPSDDTSPARGGGKRLVRVFSFPPLQSGGGGPQGRRGRIKPECTPLWSHSILRWRPSFDFGGVHDVELSVNDDGPRALLTSRAKFRPPKQIIEGCHDG